MANKSQAALFAPTHLNRGLFSDHYLDQIIPDSDEWQQDNHLYTQAKALREELRALLETVRPETLKESQLEEQWIKPVLKHLGHYWAVQVNIRYRESTRVPDYFFAATQEEASAFTNEIYEPQQLAHALALGDAKKWGVNLDQAAGRGSLAPAAQIDEYLRYSELPWGILTDGRFWRLYHRDSSKNNDYYAVDLLALLTSQLNDPVHNFYYFFLFLRREAFVREGWLDRVRQESVRYAEALSDTLEEQVYEALKMIAQGFLAYRRNRLQPDAATLKNIYHQSLVLLYRLLFILYAESRSVLPMESSIYANYRSLQALNKDTFLHILEGGKSYQRRVDEAGVYERLRALFFAIDQGSEEYGVSPYNGRLFSEDEYPFLADKFVGDAFLAPALDMLARVEVVERKEGQQARAYVDYRDLDVRHLGAIYEKLLEYELAYTDAAFTDKHGSVEAKSVYLRRAGTNERKITGSYYTPDYIVRFIVERTLEPLLHEISLRYATWDAESGWQPRDHEALRRAILTINVLDPATGSGHFMVEAVAYIAEWLRQLKLHPSDIAADEDELVYWKRQVVASCIYGVDVNPLAVELSKLSLWLATIARGKPLSFLDHHVKLGNSLVGTRIADLSPSLDATRYIVSDAPAGEGQEVRGSQLPLFAEAAFVGTVSAAVSRMTSIESTVAASVKDVKGQEQSYGQLLEATRPLRALADVWTARHFGFEIGQEEWQSLYSSVTKNSVLSPQSSVLLARAADLAAQHHFLHWELEFPEVFFAPDGTPLPDGGFDAVIGNPPYVRWQSLDLPLKNYFQATYDVYHSSADLFLYFYELGLNFLKPECRLGLISSGSYMNSSSAVPFRRYIDKETAFEYVINFGENQPFKGAEMIYPTIAILRKGRPTQTFRSLFVEDVYRRNELADAIHTLPMVETSSDVTALDEWRFQSVELTSVFRKIMEGNATLDDFVSGKLYNGILTGLNEAFIIDENLRFALINEHPSSAEAIKPIIRGQELRPWYQMKNDLHVIFSRPGVNIDDYPAIKRHLEQYRERLEPIPTDWDERKYGKWKGRSAGSYKWYEWHHPVTYYKEFEKAKIVWPDISKLPRFSWNEGSYVANTGFMIGDSTFSLLALLQSRVIWFAISQIAVPLRLRAGLWQYRVILQFAQRLPIPKLTAAQESGLAELAEQITALARERYQLHEGMRHRVRDDLGQGGKLNTALESWWQLDFPDFREQFRRSFRADIALNARDEWEAYLGDQRTRHDSLTAQIVAHETRLNAIVYDAFKLTPDEIALIEQATKFPYGSV